MGEVYRARDTRLKRDVAIKVLPEAFSQDPDRLARFQREAELLATLNNPNIAAVYGLEQSGGVTGIVLELVEGDTLADLIARGPIAAGDALPIARQIADALEAAHETGVIHRDLKPANIKVTADGKVKVLDFGLAKMAAHEATASSMTMSPTLSVHATYAGVILGTAAYMSPEQARGRAVDKRTDIWAFGCVLFEMLSGARPFDGEDVAETIGAVDPQGAGVDTAAVRDAGDGANGLAAVPGERSEEAAARHQQRGAAARRSTRGSGAHGSGTHASPAVARGRRGCCRRRGGARRAVALDAAEC